MEKLKLKKNPNFHEFGDPYWDNFTRNLKAFESRNGILAVFTLQGTGIRFCDFYKSKWYFEDPKKAP